MSTFKHKEAVNMNCPICGANIEVSEFEDGSVLIRQDCLCKITIEETKKRTQ